MAVNPTDLLQLVANLYDVFKTLHRDQSQRFEDMWEKDLPKLTKAVRDGDIETIKEITAKYYDL